MADKKSNLLQALVNKINNDKINEVADEILHDQWTPIDPANNGRDGIKKEISLFRTNSLLSRLPRSTENKVQDLANYIYSSAQFGTNGAPKQKRLEVLDAVASPNGVFKNLQIKHPSKALNRILTAVNDGNLVVDQNTANGDDTMLYRQCLTDFLQAKRPFIENKSVNIVSAVLASIIYYTMPQNKTLNEEQSVEYEKALRPLVYGLIQSDRFVNNVVQSSHCRRLIPEIYQISTKAAENDGFTIDPNVFSAYLHDLSLFSHLKCVTEDSKDWNADINATSTAFVTMDADDLLPQNLSKKSGFDKFQAIYTGLLPADSSINDPTKNLELIRQAAAKLIADPSLTLDDANRIAIALARPIAGISQATAQNTVKEPGAITRLISENDRLRQENYRLNTIIDHLREGVWAGIHYYANTQGNPENQGVVNALRNVTTYTDADRKLFTPEVARRNLTGAISDIVGAPESHNPLAGICLMILERYEEYLSLQQKYETIHKNFAKKYGIDGKAVQRAVESDNAKEQILKLAPSANVKAIDSLLQAYADYQNKPNETLQNNIVNILKKQELVSAATNYLTAVAKIDEPYYSEYANSLSGLAESALSKLVPSVFGLAVETGDKLLETKEPKFQKRCLVDFANKINGQIFKKLDGLKNTKWNNLMDSLLPAEENKTQRYIESLAQATTLKPEWERYNDSVIALAEALNSDLKKAADDKKCTRQLKNLCEVEELIQQISEEKLQNILELPEPKNPSSEVREPFKKLYTMLYNFSKLLNEPTMVQINNLIALYKENVAGQEAYKAALKKLNIKSNSKSLENGNPTAAEGFKKVTEILAPKAASQAAAQSADQAPVAEPIDSDTAINRIKMYNTYCKLFNSRKNFIDLAEQLGLTVLYNEIVPVNSADWKNFKPAEHNKEIRKQAQDALKNCRNYYNELVKAGLSKQVLKDLLTRDDRATLKEFSDQTSSQEAE